MPEGSLVVAGSGMSGGAQVTLETVEHVRVVRRPAPAPTQES